MVPGFNNSKGNMQEMVEFYQSLEKLVAKQNKERFINADINNELRLIKTSRK